MTDLPDLLEKAAGFILAAADAIAPKDAHASSKHLLAYREAMALATELQEAAKRQREGERGAINDQHYRWALAVVDAAQCLIDSEANAPAELRPEWDALDNLLAAGVHSCHPNCQRPYCRMRRDIAELKAEAERLRSAEGGR